MNKTNLFKLSILVLLVASACSTSKFDYNSAYKFSTYNYQKVEKPQVVEPIASISPQISENEVIPSDLALRQHSLEHTIADFKESYAAASKTEKKQMRKDIKRQLKEVKRDMKQAEKEARQNDVYFNKKMYVGLVVLLAGIVVAILASGPIGALAIIVGVALIAWGFIEQA